MNDRKRIKITIDGAKFSTLEEFYNEIDRLLTKNLTWRTGHNMDAFHDLLRGGFGVHEYGEGVDFVWVNSDKSRQDLGYEATALFWDRIKEKCHPTNRDKMAEKAMLARKCQGETLFDIIAAQILDKNSVYDHTLTFE